MTANTGLGVPGDEVQYEGKMALVLVVLVVLVFMVGVVVIDSGDPS